MLLQPRVDDKLTILSEKLIQSFAMLILADIHYFSHEQQEALLNLVASVIETYRPKYIVIPGDLFDNADVLGNFEEMTYFINWLTRISRVSKVFISKGNHDKIVKEGKIWKNREEFADEKFNFYFNNNLPNVALATETPFFIPEDGISITGFDPGYNWYHPEKEDELVENPIQFARLFNQFIAGLNLPPEMLHFLLTHAPKPFVENGEIDSQVLMPNIPFGFITGGHYHGGMMPKKLEKLSPKNHRGLLGPHSVPIPKDCYGEYFGRTTIVDTRGITKASISTGIFSKANGLYRPDMNLVTFQKSSLDDAYKLRDRLNVDPKSVDSAGKRYVKEMFPKNSR